jgi:hypothetical protein
MHDAIGRVGEIWHGHENDHYMKLIPRDEIPNLSYPLALLGQLHKNIFFVQTLQDIYC